MAAFSDANDAADFQQQPQQLNLWPSQREHFQRITGILNRYYSYYDTSETGAGKTHVTIAIAIAFRLSIFVVAPLSLIPMWGEVCGKYGVKLISALTYEKLRGSGTKCSHPYLNIVPVGEGHERYHPTQVLTDAIRDGVLVVFDEAHRLKNSNTMNHSSAHAIVNAVVGSGSRSRIACLSASPSDKADQAESLLKLMGVILLNHLYVYDRSTYEYTPTGIEQAFLYCNRINPRISASIYDRASVSRYTVKNMCYSFYTQLIKTEQCSSMKKPTMEATLSIRNMFCRVTRKEAEELLAVREKIIKDTGFDNGNGTFITERGRVLKILMGVHQHIEFIKVRIFKRLALTKLKYSPNSKVLIYVWYLQSIQKLKEELAEFNPMILQGSVSAEKRADIIAKFQRPDNEHRLIIANVRVGGVGLSLDDTDGNFPRFQLVSPAYRMTDLHQSSGRIYRGTTKSMATVRFIYAGNFREEARILLALQQKSNVARSVLYDDTGIVLPGDYEEYVESVYDIRKTLLLSLIRMKKSIENGKEESDGSSAEPINKEPINAEPKDGEYLFFKNLAAVLPVDMFYEIARNVTIPYLEDDDEENDPRTGLPCEGTGYDPVFGHPVLDKE